MSEPITLNAKQTELFNHIKGPAAYILGLGGSRSGKTFAFTLATIMRGVFIPGSRHGVFRSTMTACRETLFDLTFPQVFKLYNPEYFEKCKVNQSEYTIEFPNGSMILFGGLDDNARLEKILGNEFLTVYLNEISQIGSYKPVGHLMTRLSQSCLTVEGKKARPKFFFDCNPPSSKHWAYKAFVQKMHPTNNTPLAKPDKWVSLQMNPIDNMENLHEDYLENLQNLSTREQKRFISGEWQTEVDGALFLEEWIDDNRIETVDLGQPGCRIIVAVDPAVSSNPGSDETGIIVAGIDADGHGYVLDDRSMKGTPEQWARAVADAYRDWEADLVVYEKNQGGEMVETTLRTSGTNLPTKAVWASRGKAIRAEPISTLYEKNRVSHVGKFADLEDQMINFTLDFNRSKQGSPDRLDALVWALSELMTEKQHGPSETEVSTVDGFWR